MSDLIHPEGIYQCNGCGRLYPEYINGCVVCWDDDLSPEENRRKYPNRKVVLVIPDRPSEETTPTAMTRDSEWGL
jgi:hypothetical protein